MEPEGSPSERTPPTTTTTTATATAASNMLVTAASNSDREIHTVINDVDALINLLFSNSDPRHRNNDDTVLLPDADIPELWLPESYSELSCIKYEEGAAIEIESGNNIVSRTETKIGGFYLPSNDNNGNATLPNGFHHTLAWSPDSANGIGGLTIDSTESQIHSLSSPSPSPRSVCYFEQDGTIVRIGMSLNGLYSAELESEAFSPSVNYHHQTGVWIDPTWSPNLPLACSGHSGHNGHGEGYEHGDHYDYSVLALSKPTLEGPGPHITIQPETQSQSACYQTRQQPFCSGLEPTFQHRWTGDGNNSTQPEVADMDFMHDIESTEPTSVSASTPTSGFWSETTRPEGLFLSNLLEESSMRLSQPAESLLSLLAPPQGVTKSIPITNSPTAAGGPLPPTTLQGSLVLSNSAGFSSIPFSASSSIQSSASSSVSSSFVLSASPSVSSFPDPSSLLLHHPSVSSITEKVPLMGEDHQHHCRPDLENQFVPVSGAQQSRIRESILTKHPAHAPSPVASSYPLPRLGPEPNAMDERKLKQAIVVSDADSDAADPNNKPEQVFPNGASTLISAPAGVQTHKPLFTPFFPPSSFAAPALPYSLSSPFLFDPAAAALSHFTELHLPPECGILEHSQAHSSRLGPPLLRDSNGEIVTVPIFPGAHSLPLGKIKGEPEFGFQSGTDTPDSVDSPDPLRPVLTSRLSSSSSAAALSAVDSASASPSFCSCSCTCAFSALKPGSGPSQPSGPGRKKLPPNASTTPNVRPLRNFTRIPIYIRPDAPTWYLVMLQDLDPRLGPSDILDRMVLTELHTSNGKTAKAKDLAQDSDSPAPDSGSTLAGKTEQIASENFFSSLPVDSIIHTLTDSRSVKRQLNRISTRMQRYRQITHRLSISARRQGGSVTRAEMLALDGLTDEQVRHNCVWTIYVIPRQDVQKNNALACSSKERPEEEREAGSNEDSNECTQSKAVINLLGNCSSASITSSSPTIITASTYSPSETSSAASIHESGITEAPGFLGQSQDNNSNLRNGLKPGVYMRQHHTSPLYPVPFPDGDYNSPRIQEIQTALKAYKQVAREVTSLQTVRTNEESSYTRRSPYPSLALANPVLTFPVLGTRIKIGEGRINNDGVYAVHGEDGSVSVPESVTMDGVGQATVEGESKETASRKEDENESGLPSRMGSLQSSLSMTGRKKEAKHKRIKRSWTDLDPCSYAQIERQESQHHHVFPSSLSNSLFLSSQEQHGRLSGLSSWPTGDGTAGNCMAVLDTENVGASVSIATKSEQWQHQQERSQTQQQEQGLSAEDDWKKLGWEWFGNERNHRGREKRVKTLQAQREERAEKAAARRGRIETEMEMGMNRDEDKENASKWKGKPREKTTKKVVLGPSEVSNNVQVGGLEKNVGKESGATAKVKRKNQSGQWKASSGRS